MDESKHTAVLVVLIIHNKMIIMGSEDAPRKEIMKMKIRYYVCGIGYDKNDCVTDDEWNFGDFDTYEEAYKLFVKLQCRDEASFFTKEKANVCQMLLQLEECEETDDEIECVDVRNANWFNNPNFKEEI